MQLFHQLTARAQEILALVAKGYQNKAIAIVEHWLQTDTVGLLNRLNAMTT